MMALALTHFKKCSKCGCTKPATTDFFYNSKNSRYGVHAVCKVCWSLRRKGYYADNREVEDARNDRWNRDNADTVRVHALRHYWEKRLSKGGAA